MMKQPFDLNDLNVSGFIGDIKIDLSKAMIPEEKVQSSLAESLVTLIFMYHRTLKWLSARLFYRRH